MSDSILNPWAVDCLDKFIYFVCPECDSKHQIKQDFFDHAFCKHPHGAHALLALKDDITDINLPGTLFAINNYTIFKYFIDFPLIFRQY